MDAVRDLKAYEARRRKGIALFERGYRASEVAGLTHVSRQAVWQWISAWRSEGEDALSRVRHKGRPPKLSPPQRRQLKTILQQGAVAHGFSSKGWDSRRVVLVISRRFGVSYNLKHIPRLLRALGWTRRNGKTPVAPVAKPAPDRWIVADGPV